jgi:hypothetical protein
MAADGDRLRRFEQEARRLRAPEVIACPFHLRASVWQCVESWELHGHRSVIAVYVIRCHTGP